MKSIKLITKWAALLALGALLFSCEKEDDDNETNKVYTTGIFILNEGAFGNSNASVNHVDTDNTVTPGIFSSTNNRPLGDALQSANRGNGQIFLIVNNSNKVEVVDNETFASEGVIDFISSPRYGLWNGSNGYISSWGSGSVVVYNSALDSVTNITVGTGPEQMLLKDDELWVANSGGLNNDSTVSVINTTSNTVVNTILVGGDKPKDLAEDKNGNIWVLCAGYTKYNTDTWAIISETAAKLVQISPTNKTVIKSIALTSGKPGHIEISEDGETLYYGGGFGFAGIYAISIDATTEANSALINGDFYGFSVDPSSGTIYGCIAPSFTANGSVQTYDASGTLMNLYDAGIGPNSILF